MWQTVLKGLPVIIGLVLTFALPSVLGKRTHELARKGELEGDQEKADTLDNLLEWRDLIIAILTGLFVLQFSAAQQLTSGNPIIANIAFSVTIVILPLMPICIWLLADRLELYHVQSLHSILPKRHYNQPKSRHWLAIILVLFVILCYGFSLLFIYL